MVLKIWFFIKNFDRLFLFKKYDHNVNKYVIDGVPQDGCYG